MAEEWHADLMQFASVWRSPALAISPCQFPDQHGGHRDA